MISNKGSSAPWRPYPHIKSIKSSGRKTTVSSISQFPTSPICQLPDKFSEVSASLLWTRYYPRNSERKEHKH